MADRCEDRVKAGPGQDAGNGPTESKRPGSTDNPGRGSNAGSSGRGPVRTERYWAGSAAALAAEAVAAVDRLATGRAEGDGSLLAAGRAGRGEHLAGATIVTAATAAAIAAGATRVAAGAVAAAGAIRAAAAFAVAAALRLARQDGQRRGSVKPRCE